MSSKPLTHVSDVTHGSFRTQMKKADCEKRRRKGVVTDMRCQNARHKTEFGSCKLVKLHGAVLPNEVREIRYYLIK